MKISGIPKGYLDANYLKLDASNDPITGDLDIVGTTKLGDGTTNYAEFAADGELNLVGTARVIRDLWIDA